jgi:hypothetical protein
MPQVRKKAFPLAAVLVGAGVLVSLICLALGGFVAWIGSTEPREPVPKRGEVIYKDDFGDPASGWDSFSEDDTWADYTGSEYAIGVFRGNWMAWANPSPELDLTDIELQVDARQEEGPLDNNFGPLLRLQGDEDSFYWFQISGDGYYSVDMLLGSEWTTLVQWTESDAINQGLGAVNHLKVIAYGNRFSFYVNDTFLVEVTDYTFISGNIGLAAGAYDGPDVIIHFDNLKVYALESE